MSGNKVHYRVRKKFGQITEVTEAPNLIEFQLESFKKFLQLEVSPQERTAKGLQEVFLSTFPIKDYSGRSELHFDKYYFDAPKYDVDECKERGLTYSAALRVTFRLIVWDINEETRSKTIRDIKEQEVFMGDIPLMTTCGTFIINGIERVIVSQMHRSPGVFFDHDHGKTHSSGKYLFNARVIPYRGSWLDFEFDAKDLLYVRIDRKRKFLATTLLMALEANSSKTVKKLHGLDLSEESSSSSDRSDNKEAIAEGISREDILHLFYDVTNYQYKAPRSKKSNYVWQCAFNSDSWRSVKLQHDLVDAKTGEVVVPSGTRLTNAIIREKKLKDLGNILFSSDQLIGKYCAKDIINFDTGEVIVEAGEELSAETINKLISFSIKELPVLAIDHINVGPHLRNTLVADKNLSREDALMEIYRILRPGEPGTPEGAEALFRAQFFDLERYDLSVVGRVKMNLRLDLDAPRDHRTLLSDDIISIMRYLLQLKDGNGNIDDIDSLSNRRVRSVGELLENQFRLGLMRMERPILERMGAIQLDSGMPNDLINAKPVSVAIRDFFVSSPLSQFTDQHNPLSEVTHKRRVSALGPGGLTRERAGFEVRDVHPTHYGRICPVETPEGQNIGLITSLSSYARVNEYGFIETPYRFVKNGVVLPEIFYMSAMEEGKYKIAQAGTPIDKNGNILLEKVSCRVNNESVVLDRSEVSLIDVSPKQLVSVAASLIPFLEHDEANRALMGSNMQRQAVPLLKPDAPLIGTGMEGRVAYDSGVAVVASADGIVDQVDARRIVIRSLRHDVSSSGVHIYNLAKFKRSNHSTCINQRPIVKVGDIVKKGEVVADGQSTDLGELGLGKNIVVAFMPWYGYTFEDSIVISERLVRDDVYTSIHIEEFEVVARDSKLGNEEITRDLPNVSDEALRNLDEAGIISIGAEVNPGDILVGKVTPKSETSLAAEERLLRALFGDKASDVRDTSLRLPPGFSGTVVEVRVFSRRGVDKDERALAIERMQIDEYAKNRDTEKASLESSFYKCLRELLVGQTIKSGISEAKKGEILTQDLLSSYQDIQCKQIVVKDPAVAEAISALKKNTDKQALEIEKRYNDKCNKLRKGDDMSPGVMKVVKVFVAVKRKLQAGDKMAGRHGNKGVVSLIVPEEDMPFLADGTPVDMILNPLGVPSRMNVGQILETHLGWASINLGKMISGLLEGIKNKTQKVSDLRAKMLEIFGEENEEIKSASDQDLLRIANDSRNGVFMATPVFDGASREQITRYLEMAGLDSSGQVDLYDGKTGEKFDRKVTVGVKYVSKLHHLVDDKIHSRSTGPYSLITQQPLGGKAQFGGQRFGEMEVWALEAYGAAHTLREMLTIKSDDVPGRINAHHAIIEGNKDFKVGLPESFNVLVNELRALGINLEFGMDNPDDEQSPNSRWNQSAPRYITNA